MRFLARIVANALGIILAGIFIPGFVFTGTFQVLLLSGLILALANAVVRPLLKLLSLPIIFITFGLFLVIINMLMLKIVDWLFMSLAISTLGALFWGTVLVSIINSVAVAFVRPKHEDRG